MIVETITAVYQNGILKPKKPLNLNEDELVEIQITRQANPEKPLLSLWGVWEGLGELSYEDIQSVADEMHQVRMEKLFAMFDAPDDAINNE